MRKYSIIIIENDEDEQFFMKEGFSSSALFDVLAEVKNGDILFKWLKANEGTLPDVILSDLNMPGKNGYDIITDIKANPAYSHIPVIITSNSSTKTIISKCIDIGAADYVVKPDIFIDYVPFVRRLYKLIEEKGLIKV